jgi:hypothetical protein
MTDRLVTFVRPGFLRRWFSGVFPESFAAGVGRSHTSRPNRPFVGTLVFGAPSFQSLAVAVGNKEEPFPTVAASGIRRPNRTPLRIEPHFGQVTEGSLKPNGREPCDVLTDDDAGS